MPLLQRAQRLHSILENARRVYCQCHFLLQAFMPAAFTQQAGRACHCTRCTHSGIGPRDGSIRMSSFLLCSGTLAGVASLGKGRVLVSVQGDGVSCYDVNTQVGSHWRPAEGARLSASDHA